MIISVVNQKGGTGKTTTVVNLGKALSLKKKKLLLVDADPQGNLTYSLAINNYDYTLGELIDSRKFYADTFVDREGLCIIPTDGKLAEYEFSFIREGLPFTILKDVLDEIKDEFDYILIDCPPTVSYLTASALAASDTIIIPMQMDVLSIQGLNQILESVEEIREVLNPSLSVAGILGVLVDERRHLTYEVLEFIAKNYQLNVFNNYIRANVRAAEAPSHGMSVLEYAPKSNSAKDYQAVAEEFLKMTESDEEKLAAKSREQV